MGSDVEACVRGVGARCPSSFLFSAGRHNYTTWTGGASPLIPVPSLYGVSGKAWHSHRKRS